MSLLSPTTKRRIAIGVLGIVLLVLLAGVNLLVAADRTVLDADHVVDTFEEADGHVALAEDLAESFNESDGGAGGTDGSGGDDGSVDYTRPPSPEPPVGEIAQDAVTPAWALTQVDENVHRLYAYLHGERDDVRIAVDTVPIKEGIEDGVEEWVREGDLEALDARLAHMAESRQQFRDARASFEERQLRRIQLETDQEYSEAELRRIYDDRRGQIRNRLVSELETRVADSGAPEGLHDPIVSLGTLRIDGLIAANYTYDAFGADVEDTRADVAPEVADAVRTRLDGELNDTEDFTAAMDPGTRQTLETARTGVTLADTLLYLLPAAALGVAALVGWVSTTRSAALRRVGVVTALAGVLGVAGAALARDRVPLSGSPEGAGPAMEDVAVALVDDVLSAIGTQGAVLLVLGVGLIGVGAAVSRGMLPIEDRPGEASDGDDGPDDAHGGDSDDEPATGSDGAADTDPDDAGDTDRDDADNAGPDDTGDAGRDEASDAERNDGGDAASGRDPGPAADDPTDP